MYPSKRIFNDLYGDKSKQKFYFPLMSHTVNAFFSEFCTKNGNFGRNLEIQQKNVKYWLFNSYTVNRFQVDFFSKIFTFDF